MFSNLEDQDPLSNLNIKKNKEDKKANNDIFSRKTVANKKFNMFDDEEEDKKEKKNPLEELFQVPKRITKKFSFLDENQEDDPLASIKKKDTITTTVNINTSPN